MFVVALIMFALLLLTWTSLSSTDRVSGGWARMVERSGEIDRTDLSLNSADLVPTSTNIDLSIRNSGQIPLRDYGDWDVMIRYYATSSNQGLNVAWVPRATTTPPYSGQWEVSGIYLDASTLDSEVYDPNVFNPGEEMIVRVKISPAIPTSTDNVITIGTPNGVTLEAPFSR